MALKPPKAKPALAAEVVEEEGGFDPQTFADINGISLEEAKLQLGITDDEDTTIIDNEDAHGNRLKVTVAPAVAKVLERGPGLTPDAGHNSGDEGAAAANLTKAAREKLKQVIAKVEKLEEEKKEVAEQIRDVYSEAKSMGYDTKALRGVIRYRKQDRQEREEQQAILETYLHATGDLDFYD